MVLDLGEIDVAAEVEVLENPLGDGAGTCEEEVFPVPDTGQ
jgi:hypothetical protein